MNGRARPRALVVTLSKTPGKPWWWSHVDRRALGCELDHEAIVVQGGRPSGPFSLRFVSMCLRCISILFRARRRGCQYIFTFECDWSSFIIAGVQTVLRLKAPRHVILQFIMREKTSSFRSQVKYTFMKWCFSSVYLCICSSRSEGDYYVKAFDWSPDKVDFVPFHTDPSFLSRPRAEEEGFVLSAGRTFRDYATLLESFAQSPVPLVIVASPSSLGGAAIPSNVRVAYDLPLGELIDLIARSMVVVLPLEEKQISIGQSVLLEAMTMGKAVVVTRVNGTVDYVEHMKTGILVPPRDAGAIRDAVRLLMGNADLRRQLGEGALDQIRQKYLPRHYAQGVASVLSGPRNGV